MLYGPTAFSKDGSIVMSPKLDGFHMIPVCFNVTIVKATIKHFYLKVFEKPGLTKLDAESITKLYKCNWNGKSINRSYFYESLREKIYWKIIKSFFWNFFFIRKVILWNKTWILCIFEWIECWFHFLLIGSIIFVLFSFLYKLILWFGKQKSSAQKTFETIKQWEKPENLGRHLRVDFVVVSRGGKKFLFANFDVCKVWKVFSLKYEISNVKVFSFFFKFQLEIVF